MDLSWVGNTPLWCSIDFGFTYLLIIAGEKQISGTQVRICIKEATPLGWLKFARDSGSGSIWCYDANGLFFDQRNKLNI